MRRDLGFEEIKRFEIVAHRGLHDENIPENSLAAFSNAIKHGIPFEFDIHLSKDGHLIVSHDVDLKRMSGKQGLIPDLTLAEIASQYRLSNGESFPTLDEVLALNKEEVPMVIEIKVDHNGKKIAKAVLPYLKKIKDKRKATLICFHPSGLLPLRDLGFSTGLLVDANHPYMARLHPLFEYLDIETTLADNPYIKKIRKKGVKLNTWTVESKESLEKVAGKVDMITFQHLEIEEVKERIAKR